MTNANHLGEVAREPSRLEIARLDATMRENFMDRKYDEAVAEDVMRDEAKTVELAPIAGGLLIAEEIAA